jgi:hypothetical protein
MDLSDYNLVNMEGSMTQAQLMALLDQLRQGLVTTNLSGPPISAAPPAPDAPAAPATPDAPGVSTAAAASPPVVSTGIPEAPSVTQEQSWSGTAAPLAPQTVSVAVRKEAIWERLWRRLSPDPVPVIDFGQHLVVAIIAGGEEPGDRIEIADYRTEGDTMIVRYQIVAYAKPFAAEGDLKPAAKKSTQYLLTVIPRSVLKVKFERLKGD